MDKYLKDLLNLLSDDDDNVARAAMVEIMEKYQDSLSIILAELQESENTSLRRRCHQLEAYLTLRKRREILREYIHLKNEQNLSVFDILIQLHLLWFDKDSFLELQELIKEFLRDFPAESKDAMQTLAEFMRNQKAVSVGENINDCELYLLGTVLDNRYGCSSFWVVFALGILEKCGLKDIKIARMKESFYLYCPKSQRLLSPCGNWEMSDVCVSWDVFEEFDKFQIIKHFLSVIFSNAINNHEFRYVQSIGSILSNSADASLSFLPYPYGKKS